MLRSAAQVHTPAHLLRSLIAHRTIHQPSHAPPRLARVAYVDVTRVTTPTTHLAHGHLSSPPFTTTRICSYGTSSRRSNSSPSWSQSGASTTANTTAAFIGGVASSSPIDVGTATSTTNGTSSTYFLDEATSFAGKLSKLEGQIAELTSEDESRRTSHLTPQFWSSINLGYHTLLLDTMQSKAHSADILQLLHSWFTRVPIEALPQEQRCQLVNEVIQKHFLQHSLPIESKIGVNLPDASPPPAIQLHATVNPDCKLPGSFELDAKLKGAPQDLYRDIILRHRVLINLETVRLLCTHAAHSQSQESTSNLLNFLRAYQDEMIVDSAYDHDSLLLVDKTPSSRMIIADHHPNHIGVTRFSSSLEIDLPAFNSLLEIFGQYGDTKSAMTLFAELSPDTSTTAESISNTNQLLFKHLHPSNETYQALLLGYCRTGDLVGASDLFQYMRQQLLTIESSSDDPNESQVLPVLSPSTFEFMIRSLIHFGHLSPAIEVLKSMEQPSQECFIPILLEIPRMKSVTINNSPSDPFRSLPLADQFEVFQDLYGQFRSLGYIIPEADGRLATLIERVALWEADMEIRSLNPSTPTDSSPATEEVGWTERNLSVFSTPIPPHLLNKQLSGDRPKDYALSPILTDYIAHLDQTGQKPTIAFMNEMCYVFGVVLGNSTILNDFNELIKRYELVTNIHTLNLLMESYGRSGMAENVTFMYQQIRTMMEQADTDDGGVTIAPNIQTINIVLNHTIQQSPPTSIIPSSNTTSTSSSNPFLPITSLIADMQQYHIAPNSSTWTLVLMKLIQLSGNGEEVGGWFSPGGGGGQTTNLANEAPFTHLTTHPGLIWKIAQGLLLCTPPLQNSNVSSLTPDLLSQYLNFSTKLNDVSSTFGLLQAMKENALSDIAPSSDATVSHMLPHHFCLNYFTDRVNLIRALHYRSLQLDWVGCRQLLQIWCDVGERLSQPNGPNIESIITDEHFAFFRLIFDHAELQALVKACINDLLIPSISAPTDLSRTSSTATPMRLHLSSCIFRSLIQYGHIQTAVDYLDQCAREPALRCLFPPHALTTLFQSIRTPSILSSRQFDLGWMLEAIKRVRVDGPWAGLIPLDECLEQLLQLAPSTTALALTSSTSSMVNIHSQPSPSQPPLTIENYHGIWLVGATILGSDGWSSKHGGRVVPSESSQLRYPAFLTLTNRFLQILTTPSLIMTQFQSKLTGPNPTKNAPPLDSSGLEKRINLINTVIDHHITQAVTINQSDDKTSVVVPPLLDVIQPLEYAMMMGQASLVTKLIHYALGRSGPGRWFTLDSEIVPTVTPSGVTIPLEIYERVIQFCSGNLKSNSTAQTPLISLQLEPGPNTIKRVSHGQLSPNPALAYEIFLQLRSEGRPCSLEAIRTLIQLQTCYTTTLPSLTTSTTAAIDTPSSSNSKLLDPTQLGRNQLMTIWKYACESRPWYEAYSLLPTLLPTLMQCVFHTDSIERDLRTKQHLLAMLSNWTQKYASMPLPQLNFDSTENKKLRSQAQAREERHLNQIKQVVENILKTSHMQLFKLKGQISGGLSLTPSIPSSSSSSKELTPRELTDSLLSTFNQVMDHLTWPLPSRSTIEPLAIPMNILFKSVLKNRTAIGDFLELIRRQKQTGAFQRWFQRQPFYDAKLHSQLSGTSIFFLAMLSFIYCQSRLVAFRLLNAIHAADGLQLCFSDESQLIKTDDLNAMTITFINSITPTTPSPPSNTFLHMITCLLPRTNVPLSQWPNPPPVTVPRSRSTVQYAYGEHMLTNEIRLGDARELVYCTLRSPSRWVAQLLYWHFHLNQLPTDAFHLDLLWMIHEESNQKAHRTVVPTTPPPDTYKVNQYSITPRMIHGWVTVDGLNTTRALLEKCQLQTYRWFLHEIQSGNRTNQYQSRIAALSLPIIRKVYVDDSAEYDATDDDPFATPSDSPSTIPSSKVTNGIIVRPHSNGRPTSFYTPILQTYLHQLFKHLYLTYRSQMLATCQLVVPTSSKSSSKSTSVPLRIRSYRELDSLEAELKEIKRLSKKPRELDGTELSLVQEIRAFRARERAPTNPPNLVYQAFHQCALIQPNALTSTAFNTTIASLVQFESTGLSDYKRVIIKHLVKYMYEVVGYELEPRVLSYICQAALEETTERRSQPQPKKVPKPDPNAEEWNPVTTPAAFAYSILKKHKAHTANNYTQSVVPYVFDTNSPPLTTSLTVYDPPRSDPNQPPELMRNVILPIKSKWQQAPPETSTSTLRITSNQLTPPQMNVNQSSQQSTYL